MIFTDAGIDSDLKLEQPWKTASLIALSFVLVQISMTTAKYTKRSFQL
jgi:hypothetical protein